MIYLPKAFERYISSLRLYVQMSVLRGGNNIKRLSQLKKISLAEAFYLKEERSAMDIIKLSNSVLGAAIIIMLQRGIKISVILAGKGVYLVNRRLYTALLTELAGSFEAGENKIFIGIKSSRLTIKADGCRRSGLLCRLIKILGGVYFTQNSGRKLIISIPLKKPRLEPETVENEWCYILDRFSPVNIWLLQVTGDDFH